MKENELYKKIGERLRKVREIRGYSRKSVAEVVGISEKHLYNIEIGNVRMHLDRLISICDAMKISTNFIITGMKDKSFSDLLNTELIG